MHLRTYLNADIEILRKHHFAKMTQQIKFFKVNLIIRNFEVNTWSCVVIQCDLDAHDWCDSFE